MFKVDRFELTAVRLFCLSCNSTVRVLVRWVSTMCRLSRVLCPCVEILQAAPSLCANVTQCNTKPRRGPSSGTEAM